MIAPGPMRVVLLLFMLVAIAPAAAQKPTPRSGLDVTSFDATVRPQNDLYRYANGRWLATTVIADDRSVENATSELFDRVERDIRTIIDTLAAQPNRRSGSAAQQIVDLYASVVNEPLLNTLGAAPLAPELGAIDRVDTPRAMAERAGVLSATTNAGPFFTSLGAHPQNPAERVVQLSQGGLLLERTDYLGGDARSREVRDGYLAYLIEIFRLVGRSDPAADAGRLLELEISIARMQVPPAAAGAGVSAQALTPSQMATEMPGFDWAAWARPQGIDRGVTILVAQPSFFRAFAAMVPVIPLTTWRAWLAARYVTAMAPYVSEPIGNARYEFFGRLLGGQPAPRPRWKRGVSTVNVFLADSIGRLYVDAHASRASRTRVERIATNVIRAYREAVSGFDWPTARAKVEAQSRIATVAARVGAPALWRDYSRLVVKPDDLFGNALRVQKFDNDRRMAQGGAPAVAGEWPLGPQTVNAFYSAATNEVLVPAALLQSPYFDVDADDAVNYGAIGAVIGHEIGHALDASGRRIPAGLTVESLNDTTGLTVALAAYHRALDGKTAATIDGLTGDQRFFLGWARIWRELVRPAYARQLAISNPYPTGAARTNAAAARVPGFGAVWGTSPDIH